MNRFYRKTGGTLLSLFVLLFFLTAFVNLAHAQGSSENLYQSAKKSYLKLKQSKRKQKYRDQWERVIQGFVKVADRHPDSNRADDALYNAGMITLKLRKISRASSDTESALEIYQRLARDYPESRYADDAQYMIGEIYRTIQNSPEEAYRAYAVIPEHFPGGDMVLKARNRLAELPAPPPVMTRVKKIPKQNYGRAQITGIRHWAGSDYVRVVIDLDGPVDFSQHQLPNPDRVYLSLKNTRLSPDLDKTPIPVSQGYLKAIRTGQYRHDTARVVLDFEKVRDVAVFQLTGPDRIVMDVAGEESTTERFTRIRSKFKGGNASSLTLAEQLGMKINKVVIDPGHGGKDPGCIGKSGVMEKNITLDISRRLKTLLEERLNMEVVMTRDRDIFVPLDERTAIANREKADLFISVHVNAAKNRSLRGIETWFLDFGASERSKKVAARENLFSQKRMGDLEKTLNDLLLNNKTQESSRLAEVLQEALTSDLSRRFSNVQSLGVKGAPFMVLVNARMPSVLIEVSFISNPTEEKRLKTDQYRNAVAGALLNGVSNYIKSSEYAYTGSPLPSGKTSY